MLLHTASIFFPDRELHVRVREGEDAGAHGPARLRGGRAQGGRVLGGRGQREEGPGQRRTLRDQGGHRGRWVADMSFDSEEIKSSSLMPNLARTLQLRVGKLMEEE